MHAGESLFLRICAGWHPVHDEPNVGGSEPMLYLPLPGVREVVVFAVARDPRLGVVRGVSAMTGTEVAAAKGPRHRRNYGQFR